MKIRERMGIVLVVIGLLWLIVPSLEAAQITEIKVKCDKGQSVQSALDSLSGPAIITVTGICHENLVIKNDDVTLQGGTYDAPDSARSTIFVEGARRVAITGVTVRGGLAGVRAFQGASLTLENSTIEENESCGVHAFTGSSVSVDSCTIQKNNGQGVIAADNSNLALTNSTITDNHMAGVLVMGASNARIGKSSQGVLGRNQITNNWGYGVNVTWSSFAMINGNTLTGNGGYGVNIDAASAEVINNTIASNGCGGIWVANSGSAMIGLGHLSPSEPNTIENNQFEGIKISNGGSAWIFANTIQHNGRTGILIQHATAELLGENTIKANGGHGVQLRQARLFQPVGDLNPVLRPTDPDVITENIYSGIHASIDASLDIQNATITYNHENGILLGLQSTLRIFNSDASHNELDGIVLYDGSTVARYQFNQPRDTITYNGGYGIAVYGGSNLVGEKSGVHDNVTGNFNWEE